MSEDTHKPQNPNPDYQDRDINIPVIIVAMAIILIVAVLAAWGMKVLYNVYDRHMYAARTLTSPLAVERQLPGEPLLQVDEAHDLEAHRDHEEFLITGYAWIDKTQGRVRIPVDKAIEVLAERGLPFRQQERMEKED